MAAAFGLKDKEMSCNKFQKISFYRALLWASAFLVLGESFNHEFTTLPKRSEIDEDSWMCLVSLDDSKICDCFSDCPDDADEAHCHSQPSEVRIPSLSEDPFWYHKCCPLLAEENLETRNISPQAVKFCQPPSDQYSKRFQQPVSPIFRDTRSPFANTGPGSDKLIYTVKRIGEKMAKRDGFDCDENKRQIPFNYVCDGEPDCLDGSDENDTLCAMMGKK